MFVQKHILSCQIEYWFLNDFNPQQWKWINESLICPVIVTTTIQESETKFSQNFTAILGFDHLKCNENILVIIYPSKQINAQSQKYKHYSQFLSVYLLLTWTSKCYLGNHLSFLFVRTFNLCTVLTLYVNGVVLVHLLLTFNNISNLVLVILLLTLSM